jgi:hypothetical protein
MHAVSQELHGSVGLPIFESLQSMEACLQEEIETDDFCPPTMPVVYIITIDEIASITAIMTMYSKEPWALAMVRNRIN